MAPDNDPQAPIFCLAASSLASPDKARANSRLSEHASRSRPLIVAHRGASADAPENTLAAFDLAWQQGADAIEGDFHVTADGQVVCIHDADLKRFGLSLVIAESALTELQAVDVGSWKSPRFAGERIPTLAEVLAIVPAGRRAYLEIKAGVGSLPAILRTLAETADAASRLRLISFDTAVIAACKTAMPDVPADLLIEYGDRERPTVDTILTRLHACRADGVGTEAKPAIVTPAFGAAIKAAGFSLHCWTVNDEATADAMIAAGADSITTDRPAWLRQHFERTPLVP